MDSHTPNTKLEQLKSSMELMHLPPELLSHIAGCLSGFKMGAPFKTRVHCLLHHTEPTEGEKTANSLKNLSLTCKKMRQLCSPIIFRTLAVCFTCGSFSNLFRVSCSPFAGMVHELRYDGPILLTSDVQDWDTFRRVIYPKDMYRNHRDLGYWTDKITQITMSYISVHCAMSRVYREQDELMGKEGILRLVYAIRLLPNLCAVLLDLQNEADESFKPSQWLFAPSTTVSFFPASTSAYAHIFMLLQPIYYAKRGNVHVRKFEFRGFRLGYPIGDDPRSLDLIPKALDGVLDLKMGYQSDLHLENFRALEEALGHHKLVKDTSKHLRSLSLECLNHTRRNSVSLFDPICRRQRLPELRELKISNQAISYSEFELFMIRHARNMTAVELDNVIWIKTWTEDHREWEIAYENNLSSPPPVQMLQSLAKIGKATLLQVVRVTAIDPEEGSTPLGRLSVYLCSLEMLLKGEGVLFDNLMRQIG